MTDFEERWGFAPDSDYETLRMSGPEYRILRDIDSKNLEKLVNIAIKYEGWKPLGGICTEKPEHGVQWFCQAMIREGEEDAS